MAFDMSYLRRHWHALGLSLLSWAGTLCQLLAAGCMIAAPRAVKLAGEHWSGKVAFMGAALLLAIAFFRAGVWLNRFVRGRRTPSAESVRAADQRAPVLYLRAFQSDSDDRADIRDDNPKSMSPGYTVEEELAFLFNYVGPFIAIGNPRDPVRQGGAYRTYQSDEAWQTYVLDTLQCAQMVVVQVHPTEFLAWEIRQACRLLRPEQLVLLVLAPPGKTTPYARFLRESCGIDAAFPEPVKSTRLPGKIRSALFEDTPPGYIITFGAGFEPIVRPIRTVPKPRFARRYLDPAHMALAYAIFANLEDHFEQHGLLTTYPLPYRRTLDYVLVALLAMSAVVVLLAVGFAVAGW